VDHHVEAQIDHEEEENRRAREAEEHQAVPELPVVLGMKEGVLL
jgi:hypothetical protein